MKTPAYCYGCGEDLWTARDASGWCGACRGEALDELADDTRLDLESELLDDDEEIPW